MNELARYLDQNTTLAHSIDSYSNPFDALYAINPEIASLAYAAKDKCLAPEVIPAISVFRKMQRDEKIATLDAIINKLGIESEERKYELLMGTTKDLRQMECDTERYGIDSTERMHAKDNDTKRYTVGLREEGLIKRTSIMANTSLDLLRLKCDADVKIVQQQIDGEKYLSDNELKATYIEAQALKEMVIFVESARASIRGKEIDAQLREKITIAEVNYLSKIKEVEELRRIEEGHNKRDIILNYMNSQAQVIRDALVIELQYDTNRIALVTHYLSQQSKITQANLKLERLRVETNAHSLEVMIKAAESLIKSGKLKNVEVVYKTPQGDTYLSVGEKDDKKK